MQHNDHASLPSRLIVVPQRTIMEKRQKEREERLKKVTQQSSVLERNKDIINAFIQG